MHRCVHVMVGLDVHFRECSVSTVFCVHLPALPVLLCKPTAALLGGLASCTHLVAVPTIGFGTLMCLLSSWLSRMPMSNESYSTRSCHERDLVAWLQCRHACMAANCTTSHGVMT